MMFSDCVTHNNETGSYFEKSNIPLNLKKIGITEMSLLIKHSVELL